jgi:tetratricopeptide (TPR) repeat protein/serine phosphatase RsbU (regulator of sigma subunit)
MQAVNQPKIDSLRNELKLCVVDTQKVNILMEIANIYLLNNEVPDSLIKIGERVMLFSTTIKYSLGVSRGTLAMGLGYQGKKEFAKAISYLKKALLIDQSLMKNERIIRDYTNLAECYENLKQNDKALEQYNQALKVAARTNDTKGMADIYKEMGIYFFKNRTYIKALEYFNYAIHLFQKIHDNVNAEHVYSIMANMYRVQNNYAKALEYQLKAMQIAEKSGEVSSKVRSYYLVADIYSDIENYEKAIQYKLKALKLFENYGDAKNIAACYFYIAKNYAELKDFDNCILYCKKAMELFSSIPSKEGIGACYAILATGYIGLNELDLAYEHITKGVAIFEELAKTDERFRISISGNYAILGDLYIKKKDYAAAVKYIKQSIVQDEVQSSYRHDLYKKYEILSLAYEGLHNYTLAYESLKKSKAMHDSIFSNENTTKITDLQKGFDLEKKEIELQAKAKIEEEKIRMQAGIELKQQRLQRNSLIGGFAFMMILAAVSYRNFRRKRNDNLIITEQKNLVEIKNKEITDSIAYALRIQTAILPPQKIVKQHLENSFILYKPKDIVAGDFYWMETIQFENEKQFENLKMENNDSNFQIDKSSNSQIVLFAACDCTGHGVPGAMVSVVCHNALNRAVHEFGLIEPAAILDKTAEIVVENFAKSEEEIKDGMDISLCALNFIKVQNDVKVELQWAGANNPLWLIHNGEFIETKADKQPIGMNEDSKAFTNHTFELNGGDTIYIFSDGYADQFSPADKKLMKKNFKNILLNIQDKTMQEQHAYLNTFIENWKGNMEQTDDILVIGVRV